MADLIEDSIKRAEVGTRIASSTATALSKIASLVANAADFDGSIADTSNVQAAALDQINEGIVQVSKVVQGNAATTEGCASACEELPSRVEHLKEIISTFRINRNAFQGPGQTEVTALSSWT